LGMLEHIYQTTQHHIPQAWLNMKLEIKWQWNLRQVCDQYMSVSCKVMCKEQSNGMYRVSHSLPNPAFL
jgi:hypothetical protein